MSLKIYKKKDFVVFQIYAEKAKGPGCPIKKRGVRVKELCRARGHRMNDMKRGYIIGCVEGGHGDNLAELGRRLEVLAHRSTVCRVLKQHRSGSELPNTQPHKLQRTAGARSRKSRRQLRARLGIYKKKIFLFSR